MFSKGCYLRVYDVIRYTMMFSKGCYIRVYDVIR